MGKQCNKGAIKISEYLDRQIDLKKKGLAYVDSELERHLEECAVCRNEFGEQQQLFSALSTLPQQEPPEDFTAQLLARLPQPARQVLPNWLLLVSTLVLAVSATVIVTTLYWFTKFINLSFVKTLAGWVIINAVDFIKYLLESLVHAGSIVISLVKAFWALVTAYPLPFVTITLVTFLLLMVLMKLISSYQRENYA